MKKPFQVGDRVAVYARINSIPSRRLGKITDMNGACPFIVFDDYDLPNSVVHPKQCRRLIPKKRREIWVNEYPHGLNQAAHFTEDSADKVAIKGRIRCIRFIEAPQKKGE